MAAESYEILSLLMRYVFVLLGFLILWRSFRWLRKDRRYYRSEMKRLPDAGYVGEIVDLDTGQVFPLPREGVIGSGRQADIQLSGRGIGRRMADFAFAEGKGLRIEPLRRGLFALDGCNFARTVYALHGSVLQIQRRYLKVRFFAGLDVPERAAEPPEEEFTGGEYDPFGGVEWTDYSYSGSDEDPGDREDTEVIWPGESGGGGKDE